MARCRWSGGADRVLGIWGGVRAEGAVQQECSSAAPTTWSPAPRPPCPNVLLPGAVGTPVATSRPWDSWPTSVVQYMENLNTGPN